MRTRSRNSYRFVAYRYYLANPEPNFGSTLVYGQFIPATLFTLIRGLNMTTYIVRRLLMGLIVLILVTVLVFLIMHLLPGDPVLLYLGESEMVSLNEDQLANLRHQFGLDKPLTMQYVDWINGVVHGNFGTSIFYKEKVSPLIAQRLPVTINLGIFSFIVGGFFGI